MLLILLIIKRYLNVVDLINHQKVPLYFPLTTIKRSKFDFYSSKFKNSNLQTLVYWCLAALLHTSIRQLVHSISVLEKFKFIWNPVDGMDLVSYYIILYCTVSYIVLYLLCCILYCTVLDLVSVMLYLKYYGLSTL